MYLLLITILQCEMGLYVCCVQLDSFASLLLTLHFSTQLNGR